MHPHEERCGARAAVLLGVEDVAVALGEEARHRMDDARPVRTRQRQHKLAHVTSLSRGRAMLRCLACSRCSVTCAAQRRRYLRRTAAMSNSKVTLSDTRMPPASSAT